ncbi:hypothetical protein [Pseudonocardia abyssalis]|uniref:Ketohydroxyglutarate aldolase n=1 Tax=Pseudonocardia abyssalis TaxID=2792008 RepID=A0ABS6UT55_9PSEU|nr:hypothetical protein [Pseudonocardia abyssalis]MBW0114602.1 ketohydroxyglutarate aldolase [Pseudonocardia abyssalis]MBW0135439.1 ketohydroxyglutarate aldolase [Pseudonocardia abyssalis]
MSEQVSVSVDDAHVERIDEVAERCRAAGMDVHYVLAAVGMITGSIESGDVRTALGALPGVAAVEQQHTFRLPPPSSPIQ